MIIVQQAILNTAGLSLLDLVVVTIGTEYTIRGRGVQMKDALPANNFYANTHTSFSLQFVFLIRVYSQLFAV